MIDELDLVFDEQERGRKGRHRRGGARDRNRRGARAKTVVALLMAFLLLGTLGAGAWYGFDRVQGFFLTPDYEGTGTGQLTIEVKPGQTIAEIGNTLVTAGVVKSTKAFIEAAKANPQSQKIQPGTYKVRSRMSGAAALAALLDLKNRVVNGLTIPEGRTAKQVFKLLSAKTKIPVAQFEAAAKDPVALGVPAWWFNRTDGKKSPRSIEGFLFPDTYEIPAKATAAGILREMVQNFLTVTGEMRFADRVQAERGGVSPYEALTVASLAQAEAGNKDDLGKVARVAYNRVYGEFPCNCLEMDVTVNYYLELTGQKTKTSAQMTQSELDNPQNPYNRKLRGMIPTPINNPGKDALQGAMDPPRGEWLWFVAIDKQGHSAFAETWDQHLRNQQKAKEAGII
ncbi:MAG TPA: endolytic transglycosylase MltG [Micromonosporaceae bacterium]